MLKNTKEIVLDNRCLYEIEFDRYIGYQILNESYSTWDHQEKFTYGSLFRVYTKSKYLDYIINTTYVDQFVDAYTHYGILCLDQIIDIVSEDEPRITKHILS